ncbi:Ctr copper transporter family-domain-containing protein [Cristinia sonorae]|uniref:Copper transport protein n=1 Tax=Cristinia sonorae TaxID=1940300 RepID=A0A8K0XM96_9AGAR|nr:Ctr copper transporter family-domain-containing protein [Cristinia sonorae]
MSPSSRSSVFTLIAIASALPVAIAHGNGMDMDMDGGMSLSAGQMLTYFHFTTGDNLWFLGWVPKSTGSMIGACIGLFLLAILDRWIAACRAVMEMHWAKRAMILQSDRLNARGLPASASEVEKLRSSAASTSEQFMNALTMRTIPPFVFWHDFTRGVIYLGQSALQFAFMLAVMTFQLGFIFSIVIGLGVGEMLFGRYASHAAHLA